MVDLPMEEMWAMKNQASYIQMHSFTVNENKIQTHGLTKGTTGILWDIDLYGGLILLTADLHFASPFFFSFDKCHLGTWSNLSLF